MSILFLISKIQKTINKKWAYENANPNPKIIFMIHLELKIIKSR